MYFSLKFESLRWRCSLWRLLWKELAVYTITFLMISMVYRYSLSLDLQLQFEKLIKWCRLQSTGNLEFVIKSESQSQFRSAHHLPAWVLRVPGGEKMVGAVLQAALARHCRYISEGAGGGRARGEESNRKDDQEDCHPLLSSGLHTQHKENIIKAEEKVSQYAGLGGNWDNPDG